jgi:hypothetical protein
MARLHDWQTRFAEFAAARRAVPFAWGSNDCYLFAADAVLAMTGEDIATDLRGTYSTAREALRQQRAVGGIATVTAKLGEPVAATLAGPGDVVLIDMNGRDALGICNGGTVLGPGARGLVAVSMAAAKSAWKV